MADLAFKPTKTCPSKIICEKSTPPETFHSVPNLAGTLPKPPEGKRIGTPFPSFTLLSIKTLYTAGEIKSGNVVVGMSKYLVPVVLALI